MTDTTYLSKAELSEEIARLQTQINAHQQDIKKIELAEKTDLAKRDLIDYLSANPDKEYNLLECNNMISYMITESCKRYASYNSHELLKAISRATVPVCSTYSTLRDCLIESWNLGT